MPKGICCLPGCERSHSAHGFCAAHAERFRRDGYRMSIRPIGRPIGGRERQFCAIVGCDRQCEGRGYCVKHLQRLKRHGDPNRTDLQWDALLRLGALMAVDDADCWVWIGKSLTRFGHAGWTVEGERWLVHRWTYVHFIGPIDDGLVLDHLCRRPSCVNPWHLEPVTQRENVARAMTAITTINSNKTHCKYGHLLAGANLLRTRNGSRPARQCRICRNRRAREYQQRRRARER